MDITKISAAFAVGLTLISGTALAADGYNDGASRWAGGNLGAYGTFSDLDAEYSDPQGGHISIRMDDANRNDFTAWGGGVRAGYNIVNGSMLMGMDAYGELLDANGCVNTNEQDEATGCPYGHSVETEVSQSFGLNSKLGVANNSLMVYGLAGVNFSKVKSTFNDWTFDNGSGGGDSIYDPEDDTIDSGSEYVMGWRVGGGAEFSVSDQMSLFAQGTYTWLNTELDTPNLNSIEDPEDASSLDTKLGIVAINVGLNFQF